LRDRGGESAAWLQLGCPCRRLRTAANDADDRVTGDEKNEEEDKDDDFSAAAVHDVADDSQRHKLCTSRVQW